MKKAAAWLGTAVLTLALLDLAMAWHDWGNYPDKLWLHRCNSVEKLHEQKADYPNVEVDVCFRADTFDVTHDLDTTFHLGLDPYFAYLAAHPDRRAWLDLKNLTAENSPAVLAALDSLTRGHGVAKAQLIVESRDWRSLGSLHRAGYYTSCYVDYPAPSRLTESELATCVRELRKVADSGCVSALSFPGTWYRTLKRELDHPIDLLTWEHRTTQLELLFRPKGRRMLHDKQLKVVLVKSKGEFHR